MVYQTNSNALVAYKKQAGLGTIAAGAGASLLRIAGGNGVKLAKAAINSAEVRNDGMSTRGRHGTQAISAAYNAELSLGSHDPIIEAIMRSTWDTVALTKSQADFTSLTTGANTIIWATGNPITAGYRVYDVIRLAGLNAGCQQCAQPAHHRRVGDHHHGCGNADRRRRGRHHLQHHPRRQAADQSGHAGQVLFHARGI
jgi:hypothetical protein